VDILHNSHNPIFRNPFGAVSSGDSIVLQLRVRSSNLDTTQAWLHLFKEDGDECLPMETIPEKSSTDELDSTEGLGSTGEVWFQANIKAPDSPGLLWYYFVVENAGETYYYGNNEQRTGGRGTQYGPLQCATSNWQDTGGAQCVTEPAAYQITVTAQGNVVPDWYKRGLMYQIFVDRFHPGSGPRWQDAPANTGALLHTSWQDTPFYLKDARGNIERWSFFGGNLEGVRQKLPYLRSLGVSILYLNPIFEASSNHKYDTADYLAIDAMFGGAEGFEALVTEAKKLGIALILDGVFSHTGADSRYFNKLGRYPDLGAYQSLDSPYASWYRFEEFPHKYECWWGVDALPNVEEMEPSYLDFICGGPHSVIRTWLGKGAKGWRLDVADELPDAFIRQVRAAMNATDPESVLIGEVWEDASHKVSYGQQRRYFAGDELHATMNYPFRDLLLDFVLGTIGASRLAAGLMSLRENYPYQNFLASMNLIGSHDRARVLTLLGDAPPEESLCEQGRRSFCLSDDARSLATQRLALLVLWQMTYPGVPCVYYGDEAGVEGYSDPYNRTPFPWGAEDEAIFGFHKRLMRLRQEHEIFISGEVYPFHYGEDIAGFWRILRQSDTDPASSVLLPQPEGKKEERAVILINRSGQDQQVSLAEPSQLQPEERAPYELAWPAEQLWDVFDLVSGEIHWSLNLGQQPFCLELKPFGSCALLMRPAQERRLLFGDDPSRCAGVLLPLASLPSPWSIGDWGPAAYAFVDQLIEAGQTVWQLLPLNPIGEGNSPYLSDSALALNPLLISPELLWQDIEARVGAAAVDRLKSEAQLSEAKLSSTLRSEAKLSEESSSTKPTAASTGIDYPSAIVQKEQILRAAYACLIEHDQSFRHCSTYQEFCHNNAQWLEDYALFKALQKECGGLPWTEWPREYRTRGEQALQDARIRLAQEINYHMFVQFIADCQQLALRAYANARGRLLIGDIPIFVAADSADCWAHQELFWLDEFGKPSVVAGVPPDYFAKEGQRWGNPLYRWERMEANDFSWWRMRLERALQHYDLVRLDHFRGFEAYWQIDANEPTAVNGLWMKGPGRRFFESLSHALGPLPIIAEDLGFITPEVGLLKSWFGYPGMKVLPFDYPDLSADSRTVYYTGTHDNNTLLGWLEEDGLPPFNTPSAAESLCEEIFASEAGLVIMPMQDVLGLGSEARLNVPGVAEGNWQWRMSKPDDTSQKSWEWLKKITCQAGRGKGL